MNNQAVDNALPLAERLDWAKCEGMIPAIVQHSLSGEVLMQGFMTREALERPRPPARSPSSAAASSACGPRARARVMLKLVAITTDCDQDSLLIAADPVGPTCHLGNPPASTATPPPLGFLAELEQILASRKGAIPPPATPPASMAKAPSASPRRWVKRGLEVALAAMAKDREELINESADLLYHLTVLLQNEGLGLKDVVQRLHERHTK